MEKLLYESLFDMAEELVDVFDEINDSTTIISIYGKYDVIKELLEWFILNGRTISGIIKLEDYDCSYYDREFVLYLDEYGISVEKAWHETNEYHEAGYLYGSGDISFVHSDCNSKLLNYINSDIVFEFETCNTEECDCDNCYCLPLIDDEAECLSEINDLYIVNGDYVSKDEFDVHVVEFEEKYQQMKNAIEVELEKFKNFFV